MLTEPIGIVAEQTAKRAALVERLSPAARHRNFPKLYRAEVPLVPIDPQQAKIVALTQANQDLTRKVSALQATVRHLTEEAEQHNARQEILRADPLAFVPPTQTIPLRDVMAVYLQALATVGYTIDTVPVTMEHLIGPQRSAPWVRPRHVAIWLCRRLCLGQSFPMIARAFGNRNHTTPIHSYGRAPDVMATNPMLRSAAKIVVETFEKVGTVDEAKAGPTRAGSP